MFVAMPLALLCAVTIIAGCSSSATPDPSAPDSSAESGDAGVFDTQSGTSDTSDNIDVTDGSDLTDSMDGQDSNEQVDAADVTDSGASDTADGLDGADETDGADGTDDVDGVDGAVDLADGTDGTPPPPPAQPTLVQAVDGEVEIQITALSDAPATAVSATASESALATVGTELQWLDDDGPVWAVESPTVFDILDTELGFALVLADDGVWAATEEGIELSPLTEYFGDGLPETATWADGALWFRSGSSLERWLDGSIQSLTLDSLPLENPDLAWDGEWLWLATGGELFRLEFEGDSVLAWPSLTGVTVDAVEGDPMHGRLWVMASGDIYRRDADDTWEWLRLPSSVNRVRTHPESEAVWVTTSAATWIYSQTQWRVVFDGLVADIDVEPSGFALLAGPSGVTRYAVDAPPPPPPAEVTWGGDVAPIAEASCAPCHGVGQFAHEMASREQWIEEFEVILYVAGTGAMPLAPYPALTDDELDILEAWQADGFLE